jgi:putative ABC transport system substrate-binding protein
MRTLARELSDLRPDVIVVSSSVATKAVQEETRNIPIVFVFAGDPVASGIVTNIARPEGNTTGFTDLFPGFPGKWLELFKEAIPRLGRVALIFNPDLLTGSVVATMEAIEAAAAQYGVKAMRVGGRNRDEIERAINAFAAEPDGGIIALPPFGVPDPVQVINRLALQHRLPTFYNVRTSGVAQGGLMSYGANPADLFQRGAPDYVDRILRGAKPSELPVQFSTKFELVINMKTAKAIGLIIPESFLLRADELIE